jgi:phosphate transport system substrate-binding protein
MERSGRTVVWLVALLALAVLLAACGTRDGGGRAINIDGSSTIFPITEAVAEEYGILTGGSVRITVGVSGTGGGFKKFCNNETDISDASRPIKPSEVEMCARNGVEYVELPVAVDGLTVMVHPENPFVQCITVEELHTIWAPEAEEKVKRWNQVRSDWPDRSLHLYGPGVDSGTFDYFTEVVNGKAQASRGDYTASEDDNVLVQGISGDKNSLGFFGYAYYTENDDRLKAIGIDGGAGCVGPSDETIGDGSYRPLSRPLFIYVRKDAGDQPYVKEFVRYYLSEDGRELAAEVGYIPYPAQVYDLALARFENGRTGTLFGGGAPQRGSVEEVLAANQ